MAYTNLRKAKVKKGVLDLLFVIGFTIFIDVNLLLVGKLTLFPLGKDTFYHRDSEKVRENRVNWRFCHQICGKIVVD